MSENPTLFISYTHDNEEHKSWAMKLAYDLIDPWNIDVKIDQLHSRAGSNLNYFMEQGIYKNKMILCICSDNYVEKVNDRQGGAGFEGNLISSRIIEDITNDNIIPILRNNTTSKLPYILSGKQYINFTSDDEYITSLGELVKRLWNEDKAKIPAVKGGNPFRNNIATEMKISTKMQEIQSRNIDMQGNVEFDISTNNGIYNIGIAEYAFSLKWSSRGNSSVFNYSDPKNIESIGHSNSLKSFPPTSQISNYFTIHPRIVIAQEGEFIVYANRWGNIAVVKMLEIIRISDVKTIIAFEYKIYS